MSKSKFFAIVLAIIFVLLATCIPVFLSEQKEEAATDETITTESIDTNDAEKWVLTETATYTSENQISNIKSYEYDSSGRIISEELNYISDIYISQNFEYDDKNNVISKEVKHSDNISVNPTYSNWTYVYDSSSNCIKETVDWISPNYQDTTDFEYDEKGTLIKEHEKITDPSYPYESVTTYEPVYENNLCTQKKSTKVILTDDKTYYGLYIYTYDENNNLKTETYYNETTPYDVSDGILEVNGKYYKLSKTTYFTYERLEDVSVSGAPIQNTNKTTQPVKKLSDDCDKVLSSGYDTEDNFYELVANEFEDYSGTTIEIGIIKNNKWLIDLSTNHPFPNIKSIYDSESFFYYIGNGCFYYGNYQAIIWNSNNDKTYRPNENNGYKPILTSTTSINNEGKVLLFKSGENFKLLDTNTMSTININLTSENFDYCSPYSEELFACINKRDNSINGFYDINGNKKVDLSKYRLEDSMASQLFIFENGKSSFKIKNDQNSTYMITINKTGEVIDSYKIAE